MIFVFHRNLSQFNKDVNWTRKFELDIEYVNNLSLFLDIKIIWLTFIKVIKTEGVNQTDDRPMMPFDGKN